MSEITLLLHSVTARKLREEMVTDSYDQILERLVSHEQFNRLSEQLAAIDANSNMYYPSPLIATAISFETQYASQPERCHQLLTSFAIALCYRPDLWSLLLQSNIESAIHSSGLELRLIRRTSNSQQTISA